MNSIEYVLMSLVEFSELERDAVSCEVQLLILLEVFEIEIVLVLEGVYQRGPESFLLDLFWREGEESI